MLLKRIHILGFLFVCVFSFHLSAQFSRFKHLTTDDGLTNNTVYCITQDSKGFIWCGTENGINKYDGYKVTQYPFNAKDSTGISAQQIRTLFADDDNKLWIGTFMGGLSCLDLLTNKFTNYLPDSLSKNSISSDLVNSIVELDKNTLALGTSKGLNLFDKTKKTFRVISHSDKDNNSLLADYIRGLAKDKDGNLWIGHPGKGLTKYIVKENKFIRYEPGKDSKHLSNANIRNIFLDDEGLLWISLWHTGLNILNTKTNTFYSNRGDSTGIMKHLDKVGLVFSFYQDKNANIWFSTAELGIGRFNKKTGESVFFKNNPDDAESFGDNTSFTVFEDKTGLIWAGTWRNGLNYFNSRSLLFGHFKHEKNAENTLVNNNVYSVAELPNNELLIGTGASICKFNTITKKFDRNLMNKTDPQSLVENSQALDVLMDADGSYWIATGGGGLYHYYPDKKKYRNYIPGTSPNSISSHSPTRLILDNENNLWIATIGMGLNLFDRKNDNFKRFTQNPSDPKSISTNAILCMEKDKNGMIWLGTEKHGLIMLNPQKQEFSYFYNQTTTKDAQGLQVSQILIDPKGMFWLITSDGLLKLNPDTRSAVNLTTKNPLFQNGLQGIVRDNAGNMWLQTPNELVRYNPETENITAFYPKDGLQGKEFYLGSSILLKNGMLFMGGSNGFNFFDPKKIIEDPTPPIISLTGFQVQNKPFNLPEDISSTKEITLSYRDYFFSVDFAAMDFSNPSQNQFKYKLIGFNDDWVDIGKQHSITFTNLDAGDYTLCIKACNINGYWNETPLELKISITPPFWKTNWFYFLCGLTIVLSVYSYIKYREKQLIKDKTLLETKVKERTEELNIEKLKVEEAHKDIKDSIHYAQKIQSAILPAEDDFKQLLPGSFIFFRPKDIVSGDFYWITEKDGKVFYAVADCTGHGVPGGFMTMLGNGLLNELVNEHHITEPAEILNKLREKIITSLKQTGRTGENKDGMDIVLIRIDKKTNHLCYAAANNGFIIIQNGTITEYNGDKQPVGIYGDTITPFRQFDLQLNKGDFIYSFTDGYPDQFGGPKGKKFKYKPLNELLLSISHLEGQYQKDKLHEAFNNWRGTLEQVDDVCVIGVKI